MQLDTITWIWSRSKDVRSNSWRWWWWWLWRWRSRRKRNNNNNKAQREWRWFGNKKYKQCQGWRHKTSSLAWREKRKKVQHYDINEIVIDVFKNRMKILYIEILKARLNIFLQISIQKAYFCSFHGNKSQSTLKRCI